jgi:hypothetical protein
MREKGKGPSIDFCLTTGWIPTLAKLAPLNRSVSAKIELIPPTNQSYAASTDASFN